jgi:hypothetical protein
VQSASGSVREPHSTNIGAAGQFFAATQGAGGGVLHVQWLHIPPETRGGCGLHGPLHKHFLLEWAGMGSRRWSVHKNDLAQIHIVVWGMAGGGCCTCFQSTIGCTSKCAKLGKDQQKC